jgi:transposase-like protein
MYARGMTVREIQGFLLEQYGTEGSPDFISSVTDEVMDEVRDHLSGGSHRTEGRDQVF